MRESIGLLMMSVFVICSTLWKEGVETSNFEVMCGIMASVFCGCAFVCYTIERVIRKA